MTVLEDILSQEIIQKLGWTLLHFIWQAAVAASLLAILLKVLRKSTPSLRYIIACMALGLIVLLPVITIQLVPVSVPHPAAHIEPVPAPTVLATEGMPAAETIVLEEPEQLESVSLVSADSWKQRTIETLESALPYIVLGWLLGVFGLSLWHLGGWAQLQRLKRRMVKQVDYTLGSKLKVLAQRLRVKQTVQLMESALVQIPTVVGWLRPVILLPASALTGLSAEQLEAILAHELAHIKRFDYLINILQTVVEILGFYHPAVWWVSHKIRAERENCCDDLAVSISGDRVCYARALTSMEEIRTGQGQLAVAASGGNLFRRICRLVGKDSAEKTSFSWVPAVTVILLIAALAIPTTLALTTKSDSMLTETKTDVQVEDKSAEASEVRIVHFPMDRMVGVLKVRDPGSDDDSDRGLLSLPGWVLLGQAQGDVSVPAGKELRLEVSEDVTDFSFLADIEPKYLQVLKMSNTETTDDDLVHIKGLTGLLGLDLGSTAIKEPGLVHLSTLTSLRKLSLFNTQVSDEGLAHLSTLRSLKYLNLYITQVKGPGLKHLKSLTSLISLDLAATPITDESLVNLAEMTWLKKLELQDTDIGNKGLANLKPLRSLEELILGNAGLRSEYSPITDEGLVYLKELGSLKHLYLLRTRVTDAGLAHLRNLKKLEALLLTETQISGEGLAFLKDLPELKYLDLNKTAVTDKGLVYLKDLKSLSKLYISSDSISEADLEDLEKALPNCTINGRKPIATIRPPKTEVQVDEKPPAVEVIAANENLEILGIEFEPIHQNKNEVNIKVRNKTEKEQIFGTNIITLSPDEYGKHGIGWASLGSFEVIQPQNTETVRFVYKIERPVNDNTWVWLILYNPLTQENLKEHFFEKRFYSSDLEHSSTEILDAVPVNQNQTSAVHEAFRKIQDHIRNQEYEKVWELCTEDYKIAEFHGANDDGFGIFKDTMEQTESGAYFYVFIWDKREFLDSQPEKVSYHDGIFYLSANYNEQHWLIHFKMEDSQYKIDWIDGFTPRFLKGEIERQRVLSAGNLKQLGLAVAMYADDHDKKLPGTLEVLKPYITNEQDFLWIVNNVEYIGKNETYLPNQPRIPVAYDKTQIDNQSGTNVVFLDGHVEFLTPQRLKELGISATEILIETKILSVSEDFLQSIGLDANSVHSSDAWSEHLVADSAAEPNDETYSLILDDLHISFLLKAVQAHEGAKMLAAPRVTVLEGKEARIAIQRAIHYISGYAEPNRPSDEPEPKKDKVELGTRIWLKPELTPDNENIKLDFKLEIRQLLGYEERKYKGKYIYLVPRTDVVSTKMPCLIPDGKTMLIVGLKIIEQVESRSGAPLLSKLPVVGGLFKRSTITDIKDHKMLLILVKPIINPQQKASKILPGEADSEEHIKSLARQLEKKLNHPAEPK